MDPKAALLEALTAWNNHRYLDAATALGAYQDWRSRGGFEPDLDRSHTYVLAFEAQHPGCILDADHIAANLASDLACDIERETGEYVERFTADVLDRIEDKLPEPIATASEHSVRTLSEIRALRGAR